MIIGTFAKLSANMQLTLTIKKDNRNIYCGHVFFMQTLLIEHGRSRVEVVEKLLTQLQSLFEISKDALTFKIKSHHEVKALNTIRRLKGKTNHTDLQVSFNSAYFI